MPVRIDEPQPNTTGKPRPKKSALRAVLFLAFAVGASVAAAVLLTRYMDARTAAVRVPTEKVVVARLDIPVASPLQTDWMTTVDWPSASRPDGAVSDPSLLAGRVPLQPIARGEAILPAKLADLGSKGGLSALIPTGMRAAAVHVDDVVGVAGFLHPGDRVDVLVALKPREDGPVVSKIVLENVRVLAVGKDMEHRGKDQERAVSVTVATLMVSGEQSERLWLASSQGKLLLTLRGLGDEEAVTTRGVTASQLLSLAQVDAPRPAEPVAARAVTRKAHATPMAKASVPAAAPPKKTIEILRGDLFEKRDFGSEEKRP